jgi:HEAT repeat protein
LSGKGKVADRFRLTYLKSTGLERSEPGESFSSRDVAKMMSSVSYFREDNIPRSCSVETILKQAKADLKHPDPRVRVQAIRYYLEQSFPSIPISLLQEILSDEDSEVRAQALRVLIKFRNPIIPTLLKKHLRDSDPEVRIAALRGIFQQREKIQLNILLQLMSDPSSRVRRKVATLIGWTQIEGSLPILMELSRDEDSMVRRAALFSLAILYPDESENRFMEALTDSDPALRKWAKVILEKIAERPVKGKTVSLASRG